MFCRITIILCLLGLFITKTTYGFTQEEKVQEIKRNTSTDEILKTPAEHHGMQKKSRILKLS